MTIIRAVVDIKVNEKRAAGLSDEQIAQETGYPVEAVRSVEPPTISTRRQRAVQHMQIQKMTAELTPHVSRATEDGKSVPDLNVINTLIKVQRREADLLGLDAPKEIVSRNFNADLDPDNLERMSTKELEAFVFRLREKEVVEGECEVVQNAAP